MERAVCLTLEQLPPRAGLYFPPKMVDVSENENVAPEKRRLADGTGKVVNHMG